MDNMGQLLAYSIFFLFSFIVLVAFFYTEWWSWLGFGILLCSTIFIGYKYNKNVEKEEEKLKRPLRQMSERKIPNTEADDAAKELMKEVRESRKREEERIHARVLSRQKLQT